MTLGGNLPAQANSIAPQETLIAQSYSTQRTYSGVTPPPSVTVITPTPNSSWYGTVNGRGFRYPGQVVTGTVIDSTLINPIVIDSTVINSTLINPTVVQPGYGYSWAVPYGYPTYPYPTYSYPGYGSPETSSRPARPRNPSCMIGTNAEIRFECQ